MINIFPNSNNITGAGEINDKTVMLPNPVPYPGGPWYPQGPFTPSGTGLFGADNTLTTILYIGAALTLFSMLFFPRSRA